MDRRRSFWGWGWEDEALSAAVHHRLGVLVGLGLISETFETAITWDRFDAFHAGVIGAVDDVLHRVCGGGQITCRVTPVYPNGPALFAQALTAAKQVLDPAAVINPGVLIDPAPQQGA